MSYLYTSAGPMSIGTRLRQLSEQLGGEARTVFHSYGVHIEPKWWPIFYCLSDHNWNQVGELADKIGHSHVAVSRTVKEMVNAGLVRTRASATDGRVTEVSLTVKGRDLVHTIQPQYEDVSAAIAELDVETGTSLWEALAAWEKALEKRSLIGRVRDQRHLRRSAGIEIIDYTPKYRQAFKDLNQEWIDKFFVMEQHDYKMLDAAESYILGRGGHIFMALLEGEAVGTCALQKMYNSPYDFELTKMGVTPKVQGRSIGYRLALAIIEKARELGGKTLYLESNTKLEPAIRMYRQLGFEELEFSSSPYARANIQMVMEL